MKWLLLSSFRVAFPRDGRFLFPLFRSERVWPAPPKGLTCRGTRKALFYGFNVRIPLARCLPFKPCFLARKTISDASRSLLSFLARAGAISSIGWSSTLRICQFVEALNRSEGKV